MLIVTDNAVTEIFKSDTKNCLKFTCTLKWSFISNSQKIRKCMVNYAFLHKRKCSNLIKFVKGSQQVVFK